MSKGSNGLSEFDSHHYHLKFNNMIDNCMRNTFGVLTNRISIEEVLTQYSGKDAMFYGNPLDLKTDELQDMLEYFENTEEYEYCSELKELINAKNVADIDMFLNNLVEKNGKTNHL
tara:strand:+ start:357 stop:704 length:348 start_codon:yes stop_codon:yes gene_type:complete